MSTVVGLAIAAAIFFVPAAEPKPRKAAATA